MKRVILSSILALLLSSFVHAETIEMRGNLNIGVCDFDGTITDCNNSIARRGKIQIELKEMENSDPSYKVWKGTWITIKEEKGQAFHGMIEVTKFLHTSNNSVRYRVDGVISLIPDDGRSTLDAPVSVTFWISSINELNETALNGNKLYIADSGPSQKPEPIYQLVPTLYIGPN